MHIYTVYTVLCDGLFIHGHRKDLRKEYVVVSKYMCIRIYQIYIYFFFHATFILGMTQIEF